MLVLALFLGHACGGKKMKGPATLLHYAVCNNSMQIIYANIPFHCQLLYYKLRLCSSFGLVWTFKKMCTICPNIIIVIVL